MINEKDLELLKYNETFRYQFLSRLKNDCEYYLDYGKHSAKVLWTGNEKVQIEIMFLIHKSFPENGKPEWLTIEQIKEYENKMINYGNLS